MAMPYWEESNMRTVIRKWFWAWEFEKEEQWLNEMAAKGLALVGVGYCRYDFEPCEPGEYTFKLEMLDNAPSHPESQTYIRFIEETGAEQIGSMLRWVYFRKKSADHPFDLFSDNESRIKHLKRILSLLGLLGGLNLWCVIYNLWCVFYWDSVVNLLCIINLLVAVLIFFGYRKLNRQKKRLQEEQRIYQ